MSRKEKIPVIGTDRLICILQKLEEDYPTKILPKISLKWGEMVCGSVSQEIQRYLQNEEEVVCNFKTGTYRGRGTEYSGGKNGTSHCWVEIVCRLFPRSKKIRVIIDGAYAQFFQQPFATNQFRNRVRLMIFVDDHIANRWYIVRNRKW